MVAKNVDSVNCYHLLPRLTIFPVACPNGWGLLVENTQLAESDLRRNSSCLLWCKNFIHQHYKKVQYIHLRVDKTTTLA